MDPKNLAFEMSRVALHVAHFFGLPESALKSPENCVRAFLYVHSGTSNDPTIVGAVCGGNVTLAQKVCSSAEPSLAARYSYHSRPVAADSAPIPGRKFLFIPESSWQAMAKSLTPNENHDITRFRKLCQRMPNSHECSQLVHLTTTLESKIGDHAYLGGAAAVLYCTANAGDRRREEVCSALSPLLGLSSDVLLNIQNECVTSQWEQNPEHSAHQFHTVLSQLQIKDADRLTADFKELDKLAPVQPPKAATPSPPTPATPIIAEVSMRNDGRMDKPADSIVKAFSHKSSLPIETSRDKQRVTYLVAGLRNGPRLVDALDISPNTCDFIKGISTVKSTHASVHLPEHFPAVVDVILEKKRSLLPLSAEKKTLMMEVNEFVKSVFGAHMCTDASVLDTANIRAWLLANSAGASWSSTMQLNEQEEAAYAKYLVSNAGPSIGAVLSLRKIYMPHD
jgi:hypothetical protein